MNYVRFVTITVIILCVLNVNTAKMTSAYEGSGRVIYVDAVNGDDSNDGATLQTAYRTIQKAAISAKAGDRIVIREGVYREMVSPVNSGLPGKETIYTNYNNEKVVISGTEIADSDWKYTKDNIYTQKITMSLPFHERQVFINQKMVREARFPNGNNDLFDIKAWNKADDGTQTSLTHKGLPDFDLTGAGIIFTENNNWQIQGTTIIKSEGSTVFFDNIAPGNWPSAGPQSRYYIFGKREFIDNDYEWVFENDELYMKFPTDVNPDDFIVEFRERKHGFELNGVRHIIISGIEFFSCNIIMDKNCANITIDGINAKYLSHFTAQTFINSESRRQRYMDISGIVIRGESNTLKNSTIDFSAGAGVVVFGSNHIITNNLITNSAYGPAHTCEAGNISISGKGHLVSYNTCYNSGRNNITNYGYSLMDSRISYNHLYSPMLLTGDGGGIHMGFFDGDGLEIDHNVIHDVYPPFDLFGMGLYIDSAASNMLIYSNIVYNVRHDSFRINTPFSFIHLINNSGYNISNLNTWGPEGYEFSRGGRIINNIIYDGVIRSENTAYLTNIISGDMPYNDPPDNFGVSSDIISRYESTYFPEITAAPYIGALAPGESIWTYGHNFDKPPEIRFYPQRDYPYKNHIRNASFELIRAFPDINDEDRFYPWITTGAVESISGWPLTDGSKTRTGTRAVRLTGKGSKIEQVITGLKPLMRYELSGWLSSDGGGGSAKMGIHGHDGAEVSTSFSDESWTLETLTFTTGADQSSAVIYILNTSKDTGIYGDDFGLIETESLSTVRQNAFIGFAVKYMIVIMIVIIVLIPAIYYYLRLKKKSK